MNINYFIGIVIFIGLIAFYHYTVPVKESKVYYPVKREGKWLIVKDSQVISVVNNFLVEIPGQKVSIYCRPSNKNLYFIKEKSYNNRKFVYKKEGSNLLLTHLDTVKTERWHYSAIRVEADTLQSVTVDSSSKMDLNFQIDSLSKFKIQADENSETTVNRLVTDTLFLTSKCNAKITLRYCKIKTLIHTSMGGSLYTGKSQIKQAVIKNTVAGRCRSDLIISALYVNADLGNDPKMHFAYKCWYTLLLKNMGKSNVIKINW